MLRVCKTCFEEKDLEKFVNQNGIYRNKCKECKNEARRTGKPPKYFPKGHVPWNKGVKERTSKTRIYEPHSNETKLKISIAKKGIPNSREYIDKIKSKWLTKKLDFSRRSEIYKDWRKAVLEKHNYICQECGSKEHLHVHHKLPYDEYPEKRIEIENGLTLCRSCHLSLEHKGKYVSEETIRKIKETKRSKKFKMDNNYVGVH